MANIKIIDLPTGSPESTSFVEATQVDLLSESGRSTVKLALNALGNFVAGQDASPLEYGDLETESTTLIGGINELHDSIGADAYDDTATYAEGELCIYNNTLYVCTVSGGITTPEPWTAAHWTATTIASLIDSNSRDIENLYYKVGDSISASIYKEMAGRLTNAGDKVLCFYPVYKYISSGVQSVSLVLPSSNAGYIFTSVGGYPLKAGTYAGTITDGGIYFLIDLVTAQGTGGVGCTVEMSNRTITFS